MTTIQIIDDDIVLLTRLATQLEQEGYDVLKVSAAKPAVVMFEEHTPDLVVLEVKINGGEGWNLLEQLCADAPVLVLSSNGREEDVVRGLESGAVDYVPKPYRARELLARIRLRLNDSPTVKRVSRPVVSAATSSVVGPASHNADPDSSSIHTSSLHTANAQVLDASVSHDAPASSRSFEDDSIFISHVDELALIRAYTELPADTTVDTSIPSDAPLGRRLYMARRKRNISLVQVENDLRIRMSYLQAMEEEKFSLLPHGAMANHMLGAYAGYLGLDARKAVEDYQRFHAVRLDAAETDAESRWDILRSLTAIPRWLYWVVAFVLALGVSLSAIFWIDPDGVSALGTRINSMIQGTTPTAAPVVVVATHTPEPLEPTLPKPTLSPVRVSPTQIQPLAVVTPTDTAKPAVFASPEESGPPSEALPIATATSTQPVLPTPSQPEPTTEPQPDTTQPTETPTSQVGPTGLAQPVEVPPTDTPVPEPAPPTDTPVPEPAPPTDTPVPEPAPPTDTPVPEPALPTDTPVDTPAQPVIPDEIPNTPVPPTEPPADPVEPTEPSPAEPAAPSDEPPPSNDSPESPPSDSDVAPETVPSIPLDEPPTTPQGWTGG